MLKCELNVMPTEIANFQNLVVCLILSNSKFRKLQKYFKILLFTPYILISYEIICLYFSVYHFVNAHIKKSDEIWVFVCLPFLQCPAGFRHASKGRWTHWLKHWWWPTAMICGLRTLKMTIGQQDILTLLSKTCS